MSRPGAALALLVLLLLGLAVPASARHPINATEAREPSRGLTHALGEVHRRWETEMRFGTATIADRAIAAYLHHVADDARALTDALERGRMDDEDLALKMAHLEGWFRYVEARVSRSMLGSALRDEWNQCRSRLRMLQGVGLRLLGSSDASDDDVRRRTALNQPLSIPVESDFERVVDREVREGNVDLLAHRAESPASASPVSQSTAAHNTRNGHDHQQDDKHGHNRGDGHDDGPHAGHDH